MKIHERKIRRLSVGLKGRVSCVLMVFWCYSTDVLIFVLGLDYIDDYNQLSRMSESTEGWEETGSIAYF